MGRAAGGDDGDRAPPPRHRQRGRGCGARPGAVRRTGCRPRRGRSSGTARRTPRHLGTLLTMLTLGCFAAQSPPATPVPAPPTAPPAGPPCRRASRRLHQRGHELGVAATPPVVGLPGRVRQVAGDPSRSGSTSREPWYRATCRFAYRLEPRTFRSSIGHVAHPPHRRAVKPQAPQRPGPPPRRRGRSTGWRTAAGTPRTPR